MARFILTQEDITTLNVDVIVNAANGLLEGGGGVDGAIHREAGPELKMACIRWKEIHGVQRLEDGDAMITSGFDLPAKYVIHTVGPVWQGGLKEEHQKLRNCYLNSLRLAEEHQLDSIAFPNIGTGVYRYPKEQAAEIVHETLTTYDFRFIRRVLLVCFDAENFDLYDQRFSEA